MQPDSCLNSIENHLNQNIMEIEREMPGVVPDKTPDEVPERNPQELPDTTPTIDPNELPENRRRIGFLKESN